MQDYHSQSEKKIGRPAFISARVITGYLKGETTFHTHISQWWNIDVQKKEQ